MAIRYENVDRAIRMFGIPMPAIAHGAVGRQARADNQFVRQRQYPPKRNPDSKYVRTFQLKSKIFTRPVALGKWVTDNFTNYGPWVIKAEMQVAIHAGWWWTLDAELGERWEKDFPDKLAKAYDDAFSNA